MHMKKETENSALSVQESGCAAAQSAFDFAIAVPEGQIGGR